VHYLLNVVYLLALLLLSPWLTYKALTTGKYRQGLLSKFFGLAKPRTLSSCRPVAWFHGVSVGEIHLLREVVARFCQRHPDWDCVISTTTDTGFDEACRRFPDLSILYWPLDFTWAVRRALRRVNPSLVVLAEGELWPNFIQAAKERAVPVAVINGRISPRSFHRYSRLARLVRSVCAGIDLFVVQTQAYATSYQALGAVPERVMISGSVKYDGVATDRCNPRTQELGRLLDVRADDLIWIAGSTQAPEEDSVFQIYRRAKGAHANLRLFLVPRQKERFEEVAELLKRSGQPFLRRSELTAPIVDRSAIVLVDTIGELGALWGLADVAFVGGSLDGRRGGQNMIEPAAYGAAVVFGPHVWNFRDTALRLVEAGAAMQVQDAAALALAMQELLDDASKRQRMGETAQQFVRSQQGATERTLDCLDRLLMTNGRRPKAA
jgi:3-deoxy-D-manno-octulosonic-acid transferase